jgi:hypothetical protein
MTISGTNWLGKWKPKQQDYHFSRCGGFLGWATWRRAWQGYDYEMKLWGNEKVRKKIQDYIENEQAFQNFNKIFSETYNREIDT